jgi:hypothetical protein
MCVCVCVYVYIYISKAGWTQDVINGPLSLPQADKAEDSHMVANIFMILKTATKKKFVYSVEMLTESTKWKYKNIKVL